MSGKILVVTGTRWGRDDVYARMRSMEPISFIHAGDATGVDSSAKAYSGSKGIPMAIHAAHWDKYGKKAGPRRNNAMVDCAKAHGAALGMPVVVLALPAHDSVGTRQCANYARSVGLLVVEIEEDV